MKKIIRECTFETNSSSTHSLVYSSDGRDTSVLEMNMKTGNVIGYLGSFGGDRCIYNSQMNKLSYLLTLIYYAYDCDIECMRNNWYFCQLEDAICDYTGAAGLEVSDIYGGYLDHQLIPYGSIDFIDFDKDSIINFIFNKNISLKIDRD